MCCMNWKKIISDLMAAQMTQREIAEYIGVTQSAVSQILSEKKLTQKGFRYEPGQRLLALHKTCKEGRLRQLELHDATLDDTLPDSEQSTARLPTPNKQVA